MDKAFERYVTFWNHWGAVFDSSSLVGGVWKWILPHRFWWLIEIRSSWCGGLNRATSRVCWMRSWSTLGKLFLRMLDEKESYVSSWEDKSKPEDAQATSTPGKWRKIVNLSWRILQCTWWRCGLKSTMDSVDRGFQLSNLSLGVKMIWMKVMSYFGENLTFGWLMTGRKKYWMYEWYIFVPKSKVQLIAFTSHHHQKCWQCLLTSSYFLVTCGRATFSKKGYR